MQAEHPVKKKHSVLKIILYFVLGLIVLLVAAGSYLYINRKPLLSRELEKAVTKGSKGLYHIRFSDIDINLFSGHLDIKDIELLPDTTTYTKFIALKKAPDNLYRIKIKELDITHIAAITALFQKKLHIDSVLIVAPKLAVIIKKQTYNDTVKKKKPETLYQLIKKTFKQVQIAGISLQSGSAFYADKSQKEVKQTALHYINIDVKEVLIDSLSEKDTSRFYYSKNVLLRFTNFKFPTPDSLYYLTLKSFYFESRKRQVLFNGIAFTPRYNKIAFYQKVKFNKDRYDIKFNTVAINQIDLQKLVKQQKFFSSSANISDADIDIYDNNAYPEDKSKKHHWDNFPQQEFQKVTTAIKVDALSVNNINVMYAEADRDTKQTGEIYFNHINGYIFNITNDSTSKARNRYATAKLHTRVLNSADLKVDFKFDLSDKKGSFSYAGELGTMDGSLFNKAAVPLGRVKINSLAIQRLIFNADANDYTAIGKMKFFYKNLKIELLKKADKDKKLQEKSSISALANTLVIKADNPGKNGDFRTGLIKYKKPIKAPFFYFLWQSLFTGMKSSAGLSAKMDTTVVNTPVVKKPNVLAKIGSFLGISKEKREQRREHRQQKKTASTQ